MKIITILCVVSAMCALGRTLEVTDFGAKGDGKTPCSEAIQKALNEAAKDESTVHFASGVYLCHDLQVPPHVTLTAEPEWIFQGSDHGAVLKLDDVNAKCMLNITGAYGAHIHGMLLTGIRNTPKPVHGIWQNNEKKWSEREDTFVIDDTKVQLFSGHGIYLKRIWLFIIRHSQAFHNVGDGVRIHGWDGFVTDCQFSGNGGNGFGTEDCGATVMFTANRVEWNRGDGLHLENGDMWNVTGNAFDRNWGAAISCKNISASTFTGNIFRRNGKANDEQSCQVKLVNSKGLAFSCNSGKVGRDDGGKGEWTPNYGFIIEKLTDSVISGNTMHAGFLKEMFIDRGGHTNLVLRDNVGCKK